MALTNEQIVAKNFKEFYNRILPFLNQANPDNGFTPVGTVISVIGSHAPKNYLLCDGTVYSIAEYPVLSNFFEEEFGSFNYFGGDGTTTFAVPDLTGTNLTDGCFCIAYKNVVIQSSSGGGGSQVDVLPTPTADLVGTIYQYVGATTQDYTNGFFYRCTAHTGTPITYSWDPCEVQKGTESMEISQEDYDALPTEQKMNGTVYYIDDAESFELDRAVYGFTPIGTIISVMSKSAPKDFLACDGSIYNISSYPELAQFFKDQFDAENYFGGDGVTTFAVPDLRGEFLRGTGTNSHTNQGDGGEVGEHQDGTQHPCITAASSLGVSHKDPGDGGADYFAPLRSTTRLVLSGSQDANGSFFTSRPTNTSVLYCIAFKNIYITHTHIDERDKYSTTEKVVGQWIDGKPVYQRVVETSTGTVASATWTDITAADSFIGTEQLLFVLPSRPLAQRTYLCADFKISNKRMQVYTPSGVTYFSATHLIVQYTKSTD